MDTPLEEMQSKLKEYCVFDERSLYVIMAIARKKYNPYSRSTEVALREVLRKESDITRRTQRLYNQAKYLLDGTEKRKFYFYASVNPRDTLKAYLNLSNELSSIFYRSVFENTDEIKKFQKISGLWISSLMKPGSIYKNRRTMWLIDLDEKKEKEFWNCLNLIGVKTTHTFETMNGIHFIVEPFDTRQIEPMHEEFNFEIKKDSLFHLGHINFDGE